MNNLRKIYILLSKRFYLPINLNNKIILLFIYIYNTTYYYNILHIIYIYIDIIYKERLNILHSY